MNPAPNENSWFEPWQKKAITWAIALGAIALIFFLIGWAAGLIGEFLVFIRDILWPLAVAAVLALVGRPMVQAMERHLRCSSMTAVIIIFTFILIITGVGIWLIAPVLYRQTLELIQLVPKLYQDLTIYLENHFPEWIIYLKEQIGDENYIKMQAFLKEELDAFQSNIPTLREATNTVTGSLTSSISFFLGLSLLPLYLFFFLQNRDDPGEWFRPWLTLFPERVRKNIIFLAEEFISILVSFFRGQLLIAIIMGILFAIGFMSVGLKAGLWIGLGMGLLNLIPYFGTIVGLLVVIPTSFLQPGGDWVLLSLCLGVFTLVQMLEGFILTPKIMGDRTGLHPVTIVISILFWGKALNGILGMILAIPLTAFFIVFWRLIESHYNPSRLKAMEEQKEIPPGNPS